MESDWSDGGGGRAVEEQRRRWERKWSRTARDLLETERRYVEELELVSKYYDEVFRARCGNMKIAQEGICGTIPRILKVNTSLLVSLERGVTGPGFEAFSQYLHLYTQHAACLEETRLTIQTQTRKNKAFARFKKLQESRPEFHGHTLEELLEIPLQRLAKYRHYLADLLENSLPGERDSPQLKGALQVVSAVCEDLDEAQQLHENRLQLQRVQKLLKGRRVRIIAPGRRYIREGWLSVVPPSGEDVKRRMFFLFSDVLAVTSPCHPLHPANAHKFSCRFLYPLSECRVERVLGHTNSQGGLISLSFKKQTLLLMSADQSDMNRWYECLLGAVRKLQSSAGSSVHRPPPPFSEQLPNVPAARVQKRHHGEALREHSGEPEVLSAKRMRIAQPPHDEAPPPQSTEGAGWRCSIL